VDGDDEVQTRENRREAGDEDAQPAVTTGVLLKLVLKGV
jgi:hypothetical protein